MLPLLFFCQLLHAGIVAVAPLARDVMTLQVQVRYLGRFGDQLSMKQACVGAAEEVMISWSSILQCICGLPSTWRTHNFYHLNTL